MNNPFSKLSFEESMKIMEFKRILNMSINPDNKREISEVIDVLFENVAYNYLEYREQVPFIPADKEPYEFHILQPVNGRYSLLDFLINRAIANVEAIEFEGGNTYNGSFRKIRINPNRYERERNNYSADRIKMLYKKSKLHETGHALHGWDRQKTGKIHTTSRHWGAQVGLKHRLEIAENLGFHKKYSNMLRFSDVEGVEEERPFAPHNSVSPISFSRNRINEVATEYFACKYSGAFQDLDSFEYYLYRLPEKDVIAKVPASTNGYQTGIRFIYHLENLVSKQAMFNSMFFENDEALREFCNKYEGIVKNVLDLKDHSASHDETYSKFMNMFDFACAWGDGLSDDTRRDRLEAQECLDKIFYYAYREEVRKGNISND